MIPTPETLSRHELAGLDVEVADAPNPDLVGVGGRVVRETEKTLTVRGADGRDRQVPKAGTTFEFALGGQYATVEGGRLLARPARRTETRGEPKWR